MTDLRERVREAMFGELDWLTEENIKYATDAVMQVIGGELEEMKEAYNSQLKREYQALCRLRKREELKQQLEMVQARSQFDTEQYAKVCVERDELKEQLSSCRERVIELEQGIREISSSVYPSLSYTINCKVTDVVNRLLPSLKEKS